MRILMSSLWIAVALTGLAAGCGDDDTTPPPPTDGGPGTDSPVTPTDGAAGGCESTASNADRLDAPELRIASLKIMTPAALASTTVLGLLQGALDEDRFNWLVALDGAPTTGMGPVSFTTGFGKKNADGSFSFVMGAAPGPGPTDRWDPVMGMGTMNGEVLTTPTLTDYFTIPIYANDTDVLLELPIRGFEINMATLTDSRTCVGTRGARAWDTNAGAMSAYLTVEETTAANIPALMSSLCQLIAGLSGMGNCDAVAQDTWPTKPDSLCMPSGACTMGGCDPATDCNAWKLTGGLAAQGVEITP